MTKKEQRKGKSGREIRIPATILLKTWEENHCRQGTKSNLALAELVYQIVKIKDIQNEYDPDESVNSAKSALNHTSYTYQLLHENK